MLQASNIQNPTASSALSNPYSQNQDKQVICSSCRIQFSNVMDYKLHIISEFHIFNQKRKILGLEPITEEIFEQKKATVALSEINSQQSDILFKCYPCKKQFKSIEQLDQHKFSKNHKKNDKIYQQQNPLDNSQNNLPSQQSSMFHNMSKDNAHSKFLLDHSLGDKNNSSIIDNHDSQNSDDKFTDPTQEHYEQQEKQRKQLEENGGSVGTDQDDSRIPQRTSLESLRVCLFCNREFPGVKKCLDHMRNSHSFFILDIDCCINLKGLLTYIAERVQLGYLCLFCNKMFKNSRRCQQHMMDKSHCFMNPTDEHEYQSFYDFGKLYEKLKESNAGTNDATSQSEEVKNQSNPLVQTPTKSSQSKPQKTLEEAWEDIDIEDANEDELSHKSHDFILSTPQKSVNEDSDKFSIISDSDGQASQSQQTSNQGDFINVGTNSNASEKFSLINPQSNTTIVNRSENTNQIQTGQSNQAFENQSQKQFDCVSSIQGPTQEKKGLSRAEAWQRLHMRQPELLESGEIKLPSGRMQDYLQNIIMYFNSIGSRDMHYVYKQKFKPDDTRDSVILAKLQLEYRQLKALTNGDILKNDILAKQIKDQARVKVKPMSTGMTKGPVAKLGH
eukprot:403349212